MNLVALALLYICFSLTQKKKKKLLMPEEVKLPPVIQFRKDDIGGLRGSRIRSMEVLKVLGSRREVLQMEVIDITKSHVAGVASSMAI